MIVKEQKPLTIKDKCGCIFDEFVLKSAILWMAEKPVAASKTVFMHGRYPAVSIHGKKMHLHRLIYQYANQCILPSYIHVHHIDGDKLNNRVNNLKAIYAPRHMSEHNANKSLTIEHRRKIARANQLGSLLDHEYEIKDPHGRVVWPEEVSNEPLCGGLFDGQGALETDRG